MKRFAFAPAEDFRSFAPTPDDGLCHVFENCTLPAGCTPATARIGFEKDKISYLLYIDKGLTCTGSKSTLLKDWLAEGTLRKLEDAQNVSRVWADHLQEYTATGKRF